MPLLNSPAPTLRRRVIASLSAFALVLIAQFSGFALLMAYVVEDGYLAAALQLEAERQQQAWQAQQSWLQPLDPKTRLVRSPAEFPGDLRSASEQRPQGREFPGQAGRHYHLRALRGECGEVWLVAEVGDRLLVRQMRGTVLIWLIAGAILMLGCALTLGYWIAGRISAPLAQLAGAVAGANPQYASTLSGGPQDGRLAEVDALNRAFDELLQRVHQALNRERAFSQDASHELRTPLAVIISSAEQARLSLTDRHQAAALERVLTSARQLQQSLQVLLALNREAESTGSECALLPVLERVIVEQSTWHDDPALQLEIDVPDGARIALAEDVLHLLLANLIGNAMAHAQAERSGRRPVHVWIKPDRSHLLISNLSAHSLGPSDLQPFVKGNDSAGLGLGLNIVQRLADKHQLQLQFNSRDGWVDVSLGPCRI